MPDQQAYRVRVVSSGWGGAPGLSTFYFLQDLSIEADDQTAADDVYSRVHSLFDSLSPIYPDGWVGDFPPEVDLINLDSGDLVNSMSVTALAAIGGDSAGGFGPQSAMICASLSTSGIIDGRRVRGRTFLGPVSKLGDIDGTPRAFDVDLVRNGITALVGGGIGHVPMVVWSRPRGVSIKHPTGLGGSGHIVQGVLVSDKYAVLTSRRQ